MLNMNESINLHMLKTEKKKRLTYMWQYLNLLDKLENTISYSIPMNIKSIQHLTYVWLNIVFVVINYARTATSYHTRFLHLIFKHKKFWVHRQFVWDRIAIYQDNLTPGNMHPNLMQTLHLKSICIITCTLSHR